MWSDIRPGYLARLPWLALLAGLLTACGSDGTSSGPPDDEARRAAAALDELADSVAGTSGDLTAEALRHAADLVRLAGTTTTVTLLIDGQPETWSAIAEQLDTPMYECPVPDGSEPGGGGDGTPDDSTIVIADPPEGDPGLPTDCEPAGTYTMRTLLAWSDDFTRVVRLVADPGATPAQPDVPDVMGGTPPTLPDGSVSEDPSGGDDGSAPGDPGDGGGVPPDTVIAEPPLRYPGFMGEYLVSGAGMWWATEGEQENELLGEGGACSDARPVLDWAEFECSVARIGFRFSMKVEALRWEPLTGTADPGDLPPHEISMAATEVDGVRLLLIEWRFPEPPPPEPLPPGEPPPPTDSVRPDGTAG